MTGMGVALPADPGYAGTVGEGMGAAGVDVLSGGRYAGVLLGDDISGTGLVGSCGSGEVICGTPGYGVGSVGAI